MRRKDHPTVHRGSQNWPIAQITLPAGGLSTSTLSGGVRGQRGDHVSLSLSRRSISCSVGLPVSGVWTRAGASLMSAFVARLFDCRPQQQLCISPCASAVLHYIFGTIEKKKIFLLR